MEFASIEREIYVEASPDVVFEVVSDPRHVREWWPDEAAYETAPGSVGTIAFVRDGETKVETFTVVDVDRPRTFSFRWTHPVGEAAGEGNSFLVTFELTARDGGTLLRMKETGFRERGWEVAVLEESYRDHVAGWDFFLARIAPYAERIGVRS